MGGSAAYPLLVDALSAACGFNPFSRLDVSERTAALGRFLPLLLRLWGRQGKGAGQFGVYPGPEDPLQSFLSFSVPSTSRWLQIEESSRAPGSAGTRTASPTTRIAYIC